MSGRNGRIANNELEKIEREQYQRELERLTQIQCHYKRRQKHLRKLFGITDKLASEMTPRERKAIIRHSKSMSLIFLGTLRFANMTIPEVNGGPGRYRNVVLNPNALTKIVIDCVIFK